MSEENSNFHQLLNLRAQENPEIIEWLRKRDEKYTSPEIQNELLQAMALGMMRQISENIQNAAFFTIMACSINKMFSPLLFLTFYIKKSHCALKIDVILA